MATKYSLCSEALIALGAETITNFDIDQNTGEYDSVEKKVAATLYDSLKRDELTNHLWNFNKATFELSREVANPVTTNWAYQYALPSDFLRLVRVVDSNGNAIDFTEMGGRVLANETRAFAVYQRDITEAEFSKVPHFHSCFVARLKAEFAEPITREGSKVERAWREYQNKRETAKRIDAQSNPPPPLINSGNSSWVRARAGWR